VSTALMMCLTAILLRVARGMYRTGGQER